MAIPKTLIIGLGGLGSDIVCNIYQRFYENQQNHQHKDLVKFLAIDTDRNEIGRRREVMDPDDVIQTSADENISVGRLIDNVRDNSTIEDWFQTDSGELLDMLINEGAGQVRIISRLALSHSIKSGKLERVKSAINELNRVTVGVGNNINVHIVSSLAGGTGAGSFLQMAYYVRELLNNVGVKSPTVTGYFLLADTFLNDSTINLEGVKTLNVRANTYACIKELVGIYSLPENKNIPFEYGNFTKNPITINQNNKIPYNFSFLIDFDNNEGQNLGRQKYYKDITEDFLYLNAFSPIGDSTRSQSVNKIIEQIESGTASRFGVVGTSKIIFPLENLLEYFSVRRLKENLQGSWRKIDNDFDQLYSEYRKNRERGMGGTEPNLKRFFVENVNTLARSAEGKDLYIFKSIWNSTQVQNADGNSSGSKSQKFESELRKFVADQVSKNSDIANLSKLQFHESFLDGNDEDQDRSNIQSVERNLDTLKRKVFEYIENNKRLLSDMIWMDDATSHGHIRDNAAHTLNYYILQEKEALHPIAARYFLYEVYLQLDSLLSQLLDKNNKDIEAIGNYDKVYDLSSDDGGDDEYIETAVDAYRIIQENNSGLFKKLKGVFGNSNSLKEFKEEYRSKSTRQSKLLKEYALNKTLEFIVQDLLEKLNKILGEMEKMFKFLPTIILELDQKLKGLQDGNSINPAYQYVLNSPKHRDYIFEHIIEEKASSLFPEDLSRTLYVNFYTRLVQNVNRAFAFRDASQEESFKNIFEKEIVSKQKEAFKENLKDDFVGYNIIEAIKKEAMIEERDYKELIKEYFEKAQHRATPYGGKYVHGASIVKSWGMHPECVELQNLTQEEQNELLVNGKPVIDEYFNKREIIRENSVYVLSIEENFPKFQKRDETAIYHKTEDGIYYSSYKERLDVCYNNSQMATPHLDKRWISDEYFLDIGEKPGDYDKKLVKAFLWANVFGDIQRIKIGVEEKWYFKNTKNAGALEELKSSNGAVIPNNAQLLINNGLRSKRDLTEQILILTQSRKNDAKVVWEPNLHDEMVLLESLDIFKHLRDLHIDAKTIFDYLGDNHLDKINLNKWIIEELIDTLIEIGEKGLMSYQKAEKLFNKMNIQSESIKKMLMEQLEKIR